MIHWSIKGKLGRSGRPGVGSRPARQVKKSVVDAWIRDAVSKHGIRSIICLLDERQLKFYNQLPKGLVAYYRTNGLKALLIEAPNMRRPPLSRKHLCESWDAYKKLPKPVLIHCSAGIGRTGAAVRYIKQRSSALSLH